MEEIVKKLPIWLITLTLLIIVMLVAYAIYDNRPVDIGPVKFYSRQDAKSEQVSNKNKPVEGALLDSTSELPHATQPETQNKPPVIEKQKEQNIHTPPVTIELPASRFVRGEKVAMATGGVAAAYGNDVLMNAPPYTSGPNAAEFEVRPATAGQYQFRVRYASKDSRPLTLTLNGRQIMSNALSAPTGCFEASCQVWLDQGEISLQDGLNIIRLQTPDVFPHITALKFTSMQ